MARVEIVGTGSKQFREKPKHLQTLINESLDILANLGVPVDGTPRALEMMGMAFLAVCDMRRGKRWSQASDGHTLKTRDIIAYLNFHFGEEISEGSYDDIRRKYLKLPVLAGIVVHSDPSAARNDPTRGYALSPEFESVVRAYGTQDWKAVVAKATEGREALKDQLVTPRHLKRLKIRISTEKDLEFEPGDHNEIIKAVIEAFLPRFGRSAEVLYVGDASNKLLHVEEDRLRELKFFEIAHGELPDVIAYSESTNWLFIIEAVHSAGAISAVRHLELERLMEACTADVVYVTAFAERDGLRKFINDIAWETEVWLVSEPDHVIHFDGEKFLGPY